MGNTFDHNSDNMVPSDFSPNFNSIRSPNMYQGDQIYAKSSYNVNVRNSNLHQNQNKRPVTMGGARIKVPNQENTTLS